MARTGSYIIIERDTARRILRIGRWLVELLATGGPGWSRHANDLRLACDDVEDAIKQSDRRTAEARRSA